MMYLNEHDGNVAHSQETVHKSMFNCKDTDVLRKYTKCTVKILVLGTLLDICIRFVS